MAFKRVAVKRSRKLILFAALALAGLGGWYLFGSRTVPAGQPPLADLSVQTIGALQADFNRSAGSVRVILLLSPT